MKPTRRAQPYRKNNIARQPGHALRAMTLGRAQAPGPLGSFRSRLKRKMR